MPSLSELATRRKILKYIGITAAVAAIPAAFVLGRSSAPPPAPETPKPLPETPKPAESTPPDAVSQPKPTARPTAFIPELAIPTRPLPPTPKPTEKPRPTELPSGKIWEVPLRENLRPDGAFTIVQNRLFAVNPAGTPVELNLNTGKPEWEWERRGIICGRGNGLVYFLNLESFRVYAVNADTKQEKWKYALPNTLFGGSAPGETSAAMVGLHFWTAGEYIAFESTEGIAVVNNSGETKVITNRGGKFLLLTENKLLYNKWANYQSRIIRAEKPVGDDLETWEIENGPQVSDREIVIHQEINRNSFYGASQIYARETKTGKIVWNQEFLSSTVPVFLSSEIVILEDPDWKSNQQLFYYLYSRKDWKKIDELPKQPATPLKFFSKDNWTFASHPRNGTMAFLDGKYVWQNEDTLSATHCLGEINGTLILARENIRGQSSNPEGAVWCVDIKTGKKFAWPPVYFDPFMTDPLRLGDKLIVSHGVGGKRFELDVLNLITGKKSNLLSPNLSVQRLLNSGVDNIIVGLYSSKLVALRV
ncbi:MAG: hypothetical protein G01um10145_841 [Microgenomates group bacterium Gr01-1014_5]|nr:MAG: hypothetical protein G01um10145_841 [Microgenomates group bacterium Gr01-1014_5]